MALFGTVAALLIFVAVVALNNVKQSEITSDWVNNRHAVILESVAIESALQTAEANLRNYVLSGDDRDQAAYREAFSEMLEHLEVAKSLTKDNLRQQERVAELETLIDSRVEFARKVVVAQKDESFEAARGLIRLDAADQTLRQTKRLILKMKEEQAQLLQERDRENYLQAQATRYTVYGAAALNVALIGLIFWLIRLDLKSRRLAAGAMQLANEQLEEKVAARTAEIIKVNEALTMENLERKWSQYTMERQFRHFEQILHSIGDAVFVIGRTGRIIRVNPSGLKMTGLAMDRLVGQSLADVVQPDEGTDASPFVTALKEGRDVTGVQATLKVYDSQPLKVVARAFPVRDNDRVVGAVVFCARD